MYELLSRASLRYQTTDKTLKKNVFVEPLLLINSLSLWDISWCFSEGTSFNCGADEALKMETIALTYSYTYSSSINTQLHLYLFVLIDFYSYADPILNLQGRKASPCVELRGLGSWKMGETEGRAKAVGNFWNNNLLLIQSLRILGSDMTVVFETSVQSLWFWSDNRSFGLIIYFA